MHSKLNLCTFCTVMRHIIIVECKCKCVYSRIYCSFNLRSKKRILFGNIYIIYCARLYIYNVALHTRIWNAMYMMAQFHLSSETCAPACENNERIKNYHLQNLKRDTGGLGRSFFSFYTSYLDSRSLKGMLQFCSNNSVHDKIWISNIYISFH